MVSAISYMTFILLQYVLLFMFGTIIGWILEVFWRKFSKKQGRWMNPGFLNGPWLPLYGFGTITLYLLCKLNISIVLLSFIFFIGLSLLEFIAGLIFTKYFKIRLWDYSNNRFNIKGLICLKYSIYWTVLGLIFFYLIFPYLETLIEGLYQFLHLSFFVGIYTGLFTVDLWQSFDLAARLKLFVNESEEKWTIDFEGFKLELRDRIQAGFKNRTHYLLPFRGELGSALQERLRRHRVNVKKENKMDNHST